MRKIIQTLCEAAGPSGEEKEVAEVLKGLLCNLAFSMETDPLGSMIVKLNEPHPDKPVLLLDAHFDEIGFIVTEILDGGFLRLTCCGGVDRRCIAGSQVTVLAKKRIEGIVCGLPPHLRGEKDPSVPGKESIYLDCGRSEEEISSIVRIGDRCVFRPRFTELLGDKVSCKSLDNRTGCAVLIRIAQMIHEAKKECPFHIVLLFSSREETGEQGATAAAYHIAASEALIFDVSYGYTPDAPRHRCGEMGKGPMIGYSPVLSRTMSDRLIQLAKEKEIPYQLEVMSPSTGTNADAIMIAGTGTPAGMLSVPLRYMHTPSEVISLSDIEYTAKLAFEYLMSGGMNYD